MKITERRLRSVIRNVIREMHGVDISPDVIDQSRSLSGQKLKEKVRIELEGASNPAGECFKYVDLYKFSESIAEMCGGRGAGDEYVEAIFTILDDYADHSRSIEAGADALGRGKTSDPDENVFVCLTINDPMGVASTIVAQCARSEDATHDFNLSNQY